MSNRKYNYKMRKRAAREELVFHRARRPSNEQLVKSDTFEGTPLHIKLVLMIQFDNSLDKRWQLPPYLYKTLIGSTTTRKSFIQMKA